MTWRRFFSCVPHIPCLPCLRDNLEQKLHEHASMNVPYFSLSGIYKAKVVSVYDGDTVNVCFYIFDNLHRFRVRLDGIDTPEIKTQSVKEKRLAIQARDLLRAQILDKIVLIDCRGFDKYGRLLGVLYKNDGSHLNINQFMLDAGVAQAYDGGTKEKWN